MSDTDDADRLARLDRFERVLARVFESAQQDDLERRAMAVLEGVALQLRQAGQALETAAKRLKQLQDGYMASQTKQAAVRALRAAEGLVRE